MGAVLAHWRRILAALLAVAGLGLMISGTWIPVKAVAAQVLLHRAWQRTAAGELRQRPWPWCDSWPVARLHVERLEVDAIVLAGASGSSLAFGPGHVDGSAAPGQRGNCVIGGHRDTHFAFLSRLEVGDEITLEVDGSVVRYRVSDLAVVDHREVALVADPPGSLLTLVTCYPFDAVRPGGPLRYVVVADLVT